MAGEGRIVGDVRIKVWPDTRGFKKRLKREVNDAIREAQNEIKDLKITADTSAFRRQVKAAAEYAQRVLSGITGSPDLDPTQMKNEAHILKAELEKILSDIEATPDLNESMKNEARKLKAELEKILSDIEADPELDGSSMKEETRKLAAEIEKILADIEADPELDSETAKESARKLKEHLDEILDEIDSNVELDTTAARKEARGVKEVLEEILDHIKANVNIDMQRALAEAQIEAATRPIEVDVKTELDDASFKLLQARLNTLESNIKTQLKGEAETEAKLKLLSRDRRGELKVDVDHGALDRINGALSKLMSSLSSASGPARTFAGGVGEALSKVSGLNIALMVTKEKFEIMRDFDTFAIKAGKLATGLGMSAMSLTSFAGNIMSIGNSITQMLPGALALPGIFGGLAVGIGATALIFKDLKKDIGEAFKDAGRLKGALTESFQASGALNAFASLSRALFAELHSYAHRLGGDIGVWFGQLAGAFQSSLLPKLPAMFDKLSESMNIARGAITPLVNLIGNLGTIGTAYLPRLAGWFVNLVSSADSFIQRALASGDAFRWIDTAIYQMQQFWGVLVNLSQILYGVGKAAQAAGGATLATLNAALGRVAATVNSPEFQSALTNAFRGAYDGMNQIAKVAGPAVTQAFLNVANAAGTIFPQIGGIVGTMVQYIARLVGNPSVLAGLSALLSGVQSFLNYLGAAVDPIGAKLGAVGKFLGTFLSALGPIITTLLTQVAVLAETLLPALEPLVRVLGSALNQALVALSPVLKQVADLLAVALTKAVQAVTPYLPQLISGFAQLVNWTMQLIPQILPLAVAFGTNLVNAIKQIAPIVGPLIGMLAGGLLSAFGALSQALQIIVPVIGTALAGAFRVVQPYLPMLASALGAIVAIIPPLVAALAPLISGLVQGLAPIVAVVIGLFSRIATEIFPLVVSTLGPVISKVGELIKSAGEKLAPILKTVGDIFINVTKNILPPLGEALGRLVDAIRPVVDAILTVVGWLLDKLAPAITWIATTVLHVFIDAINGLAQIFEGAFKLIKGVWDVFAGFFTGDWSRVWDGIKNILGGALDIIVGAVKIFFAKGMGEAFSAGWAALKGIWSAGIDLVKSLGKAGFDAVTNFAKNFFQNNLQPIFKSGGDAIKGVWDTAWGAIKNVFKTAIDWVVGGVKNFFSSLGEWFMQGWQRAGKTTSDFAGQLKKTLGDLWNQVLNGIKTWASNTGKSISDWVSHTVKSFGDWAKNMVNSIVNGLKSSGENIGRWAGDTSRGFVQWIRNVVTSIGNWARDFATNIVNGLRSAGENIGRWVSDAARAFGDWVRNVAQNIGQWARDFPSRIGDGLRDAINHLARFAQDAWHKASEAGRNLYNGVVEKGREMLSWFGYLPQQVWNALSNLGSWMSSAGKNIVYGIMNGMNEVAHQLYQRAADMARSALNTFKSWLGIRSPSREFAKVGRFMIEGLIVGLDDQTRNMVVSMQELGTNAVQSMVAGMESEYTTMYDSVANAMNNAGGTITASLVTPSSMAGIDSALVSSTPGYETGYSQSPVNVNIDARGTETTAGDISQAVVLGMKSARLAGASMLGA